MPKEIYAILKEIIGEHAPSYAGRQVGVVQYKSGKFSICVKPRPGRPKTVTTPEFIENIH